MWGVLSLQSPAQPDVNAFGSACGVGSQRLGSGSGHLGSDRRASDFAGGSAVWVCCLFVCQEPFFRSVYFLTPEGVKCFFFLYPEIWKNKQAYMSLSGHHKQMTDDDNKMWFKFRHLPVCSGVWMLVFCISAGQKKSLKYEIFPPSMKRVLQQALCVSGAIWFITVSSRITKRSGYFFPPAVKCVSQLWLKNGTKNPFSFFMTKRWRTLRRPWHPSRHILLLWAVSYCNI